MDIVKKTNIWFKMTQISKSSILDLHCECIFGFYEHVCKFGE